MEQQSTTIDEAFDVGIWVGRKQAFALVAGRCLAADAEILFEIREKKLFRTHWCPANGWVARRKPLQASNLVNFFFAAI